MSATEACYVNIYCRNCDTVPYRSIRPIQKGEPLAANLFTPTPTSNEMKCDVCQGKLVAVPVQTPDPPAPVSDLPPATRSVEAVNREAYEKEMSRANPGVVEVFRVEAGENVVNIEDSGNYLLVITTKRILKVLK